MGHFLRGDKWSTFETGKSLGHIAFLNFKQCLFRWSELYVDENRPEHRPDFAQKSCYARGCISTPLATHNATSNYG